MTPKTRMDVYVKGERVFAYVQSKGSFSMDDVEVKVTDSTNFSGD